MPTQVLSTASTSATSSDITVVAGTPQAFSLKGVTDGQARVLIRLKDDAGAYNVISELTSHRPSVSLSSPGVYQFERVAGATCGVYVG